MKNTLIEDIGLVGYNETWSLQQNLMNQIIDSKKQGINFKNHLLLLEHNHVYTLGKSGDEANMLLNLLQLRAANAEFVKVDRGGDITYHGPGQLVAYPIIDLESFGMGVKDFVYALEEVVIRMIADYGIVGGRLDKATGVWLDIGGERERKIAAIGVKCSRFVTMHGFALNVNTDMSYFNNINPCGFVDKGVTSISQEIGSNVEMSEVKEKAILYFTEVFGDN